MRSTDTIAALATPNGRGALGIIRLSGKNAIGIADQLMPKAGLLKKSSHTVTLGWIYHNGQPLDEALATIFRAPKSYTAEDVIELSCHGSPYILQEVLSACVKHGARLATAGEFTQRAFFNGRLDLTQAEAVADLIAAESKLAHKTALQQMRGGFSNELNELRDKLINLAALVELELDFSDEDVEFADRSQLQKLITLLQQRIHALIRSFELGNVLKQGVSVAIVGRPNAGKSTLLNALLNEERAIVSEIAGTTRDTIEDSMQINGLLFRLIDTAGIRDHSADSIESIGIERSRSNAEKADIIIYLRSMEDMFAEEKDDKEIRLLEKWLQPYRQKVIEVNNKYDEVFDRLLAKRGLLVDLAAGIYISAKHKQGLEFLTEALFNKAGGNQQSPDEIIVTNVRHLDALNKIQESLQAVAAAMDHNISGDLMAVDLRRCLYYLGEITGQVETDRDILGTIFGKFCIGK